MSSLGPQKVDVLIVGAGPAGVMTALSLLKCGVKELKLVDFAPKKTVGYADGVMPRTIEGMLPSITACPWKLNISSDSPSRSSVSLLA